MKQLNADDLLILRSFVESPAYPVMKRIMEIEVHRKHESLIACEDMKEVFRIQGEIRGIRTMENLPRLITEATRKIEIEKPTNPPTTTPKRV